MQTPKYSFLKGLSKTLINLVIFSLPMVIDVLPPEWNITISGAIYMLLNYLKVKNQTV